MKRKFCASVIAASMAVLIALSGWATEPFTAHASPFVIVQVTDGATLVASGECGAEGPNVTWEFYDNGVLVISGTGEMEDYSDYVSPPWISQGYGQSITDVAIESGVTNIGDYAFEDCDSLITVAIFDGLVSIGEFAFENCGFLTTVTIPDSVTTIGEEAFARCSSLGSITIPDSVMTIGEDAFSNCSALVSITIPDSVTTIGDDAFSDCRSLENVTVPGSVTYIAAGVFSGCSSLTSVTISEGVESIAPRAFADCVSLKTIKFPDSLVAMSFNAFENCSGLETLVIPSCSIGYCAFTGCDSLSTIYFDGVSGINVEWGGGEPYDFKPFDGATATVYYRESDNWPEEEQELLSTNANLTWVALDDDEFNSRAGISSDGSEANPPSDNANGNNNASSETGQLGSWQKNSVGWWWEYPDGTYPVSKWELINGKWYYFNSSGYMAIGWQKINGSWYYLGGANDGAMKTGWQLINGYWYYLGGANDGAMKTGWQFIDGHWYYLGGANDGAMKTGWQQVGGTWYFMYPNGEMASDTYIDNYYVDASGARVQNGSHDQNGGNTAGSGVSSGSSSSGSASLSGRGSWVRSGNRWWYRHPDGGYTTNGWEFIDGKWYYFDAAGWMVTGWRQVNGLWYYMDQNGAMQTGWLQLKDTWYYLYDNGAMATDTWIGNDYVDASGAWVPDAGVDTGVNANVFGSGTANSVVAGFGS